MVQGPHAPLMQACPAGHWLFAVQAPHVPSALHPCGGVHCEGVLHAPHRLLGLRHTNPPLHDSFDVQGDVHTPMSQTSGAVQSAVVAQVVQIVFLHTCPTGHSALLAQGPQLPASGAPRQPSPAAHCVAAVQGPHTPATQA
jgi:hypothetical protein